MMSSNGAGSNSRRRSLDAEINLVPFIDLLSMCICFLLITAVWIQIGSLPVKQSRGTEATLTSQSSLEMDLRFTGPTTLEVNIKKRGASIKKLSYKATTIEELSKKLDSGLQDFLTAKYDLSNSIAMITPRSGVSYGNLITIMDLLRKNKIMNLGIVPVGENYAN